MTLILKIEEFFLSNSNNMSSVDVNMYKNEEGLIFKIIKNYIVLLTDGLNIFLLYECFAYWLLTQCLHVLMHRAQSIVLFVHYSLTLLAVASSKV